MDNEEDKNGVESGDDLRNEYGKRDKESAAEEDEDINDANVENSREGNGPEVGKMYRNEDKDDDVDSEKKGKEEGDEEGDNKDNASDE